MTRVTKNSGPNEAARRDGRARRTIGVVALVSVLALAGCSAASDSGSPAGSTPSASPHNAAPENSPTPANEATAATVTDADTCMAIGDVVSIRFNADVAVSEGRMSTQEQSGWYRLATVVLSRVPTTGEGDVSESVTALQSVIPPVPLAAAGSGQIASRDWDDQWTAVLEACKAAGYEYGTVAFTGG